MTDVTLSAATQSALLLTKRTTALAARISERIATELRVTRAADEAAAGFVAQLKFDLLAGGAAADGLAHGREIAEEVVVRIPIPRAK